MSKRYFLAPSIDLQKDLSYLGSYHYITLSNNQVAIVLMDCIHPPDNWTELPHPLDPKTELGTLSEPLKEVGALPNHGGFQVAKLLAKRHPLFEP